MKFKVWASLGYANADRRGIIEVDDEDLEDRNDIAREKVIEEYVMDWLYGEGRLEVGWEPVEK